MNNEKLRQIQEIQWEEGLSMIACTIFHGNCTYKGFLDTNPTPEEKKYVDNWLRGNLVGKDKDKIIPGFNG